MKELDGREFIKKMALTGSSITMSVMGVDVTAI